MTPAQVVFMDEINVWGFPVTCYLLGPSTLHVVISAQLYGFYTVEGEFHLFSFALFSDHPEKGLLSSHKFKYAIFVCEQKHGAA